MHVHRIGPDGLKSEDKRVPTLVAYGDLNSINRGEEGSKPEYPFKK